MTNHQTPDQRPRPDFFQARYRNGLPKRPSSQGDSIPQPPPIEPQPDRLKRSTVALKQVPSRKRKPKARPNVALKLQRLLMNWRFWAVSTVAVSGGVGLLALAMLLQLPALPNCPAIFWPLASASIRLSCAQIAANKQTVKDLLEAIALVNSLPADHPLRPEVNRLTEQWSQDILRLAEAAFQAGKLNEAISAARKIPKTIQAYPQVEKRIQRWQSIWSEAEGIYKKAEAELRQENFGKAFMQAVQLLSVGNTYWETTKYQELTKLITTTRADGNKLGRARRLADYGNLTDLLEAIKLAESIDPKSHLYAEARKAIVEFGHKMMNLAQAALDRRDYQGALSIVGKIPASANLQKETEDFTNLAQAQSQAWTGSVSDIEQAILQAQRIKSDRPLYGRAQQLISRWQLEIGDVTHLDKARTLAQAGAAEDLNSAISEASLIPRGNPRWNEAQREIARWTGQIQTLEDQPFLDQADQLASGGDIASLQAAIAAAQQVEQNRALSKQAQSKIRNWTSQIQRTQDQPYLDQAKSLADSGNLNAAIDAAAQIGSGRSLYNEAQASIKTWRNQIQAQQSLGEAYRLANSGGTDALAAAIATANRVPASSSSRTEADNAINQWSRQILEAAKSQAESDLGGAIATAQKVPPRTEAYAEAQLQIESWKKSLKP